MMNRRLVFLFFIYVVVVAFCHLLEEAQHNDEQIVHHLRKDEIHDEHDHDEHGSCMHDKIFGEMKELPVEKQESDYLAEAEEAEEGSSGVNKAAAVNKAISSLTFEVIYDETHCKTAGQTINLITGCGAKSSYTCTANDVLTTAKSNFLKNDIIPRALRFWTDTLSIDINGGVSISSTTCCGISTPSRSTSKSYIIFISFHPTQGSTLAWAGACLADGQGRPIAGHANFGPNKININDVNKEFTTAVHEIAHALGFSSNFYRSFGYRDASGRFIRYSAVTKTVIERGNTVTKFVTPKVTQFVKDHFGCQIMTNPGAEIEDAGGSGTSGSHFEKRIFANEVMTGSSDMDSIITPLTLSLFEDMGWYRVSYSSPEIKEFKWGKGEGCGFAQEKCNTWNSRYFCSFSRCQDKRFKGCTFDSKAKAYCALATYTANLPTQFQYFSNPKMGGEDEFADFCPMYQPFSNGNCQDSTLQSSAMPTEFFSSSSLCFTSTISTTSGPSTSFTDECNNPVSTFCHRSTCLNEGTTSARLRVYFGSTTNDYVDCPTSGGIVSIYNNLSSRKTSCVDDRTWSYGSLTCASLGSSSVCRSYRDYGQFTRCPVTCGTCAAYTGDLTCPPVRTVCNTVPTTPKSLSGGAIAGVTIGVTAAAALIIGLTYKRANKKKQTKVATASLLQNEENTHYKVAQVKPVADNVEFKL